MSIRVAVIVALLCALGETARAGKVRPDVRVQLARGRGPGLGLTPMHRLRIGNPLWRIPGVSTLSPGSPRLWDGARLAPDGALGQATLELLQRTHDDVTFYRSELEPWNRQPPEANLNPFPHLRIAWEQLLYIERGNIYDIGYRWSSYDAEDRPVRSQDEPLPAEGVIVLEEEGGLFKETRVHATWRHVRRRGNVTDRERRALPSEQVVIARLVEEGHDLHLEAPADGTRRNGEGHVRFTANGITPGAEFPVEFKQLNPDATVNTLFGDLKRSMSGTGQVVAGQQTRGQSAYVVVNASQSELTGADAARGMEMIVQKRIWGQWPRYNGRLRELRVFSQNPKHRFDITYSLYHFEDLEVVPGPPDFAPEPEPEPEPRWLFRL